MAKASKIKSMEQCTPAQQCCTRGPSCTNSGIIYGLGVIGAAIYYIQTSTGFWNGAFGLLKALVWPAMLVYKLLGL